MQPVRVNALTVKLERRQRSLNIGADFEYDPMIVVKRPLALIVLSSALAGCTPDYQQRTADIAVDRILRDREKETLGYRPEVKAQAPASAEPTRKSYEKLPVTAIAPVQNIIFERSHVTMPPTPLGPQLMDFDPATPLDLVPVEGLRAPSLSAHLGPPSPTPTVKKVDLFQAIEFAVQHSRAYQDRMEDLFLATLDVTLQRHLFTPRPFMTSSVGYSGGQADVNYRSALTATNSIGLRQRLPYGGEIVARQLVRTVDALTDAAQDGESAGVALEASIPLLRGAGLVNLEGLISAERDLVYGIRDFESYRRGFVVSIASQYFRLISQQQGIGNRRRSYENLRVLTERTQAMYEAGKLSYVDVQRSLQNQLAAENQLIIAINDYQTALDDFKITLGMDVQGELEVAPVELEISMPSHPPDEAAALAIRYRLDLQTARDRIEDARRGVSNARNGLLPGLDLRAGGELGSRPGESMSNWSHDTANYSADVVLDWPIDRVAERNEYRRALIRMERAQRSLAGVQDNVIADVRETTCSIRTAESTLRIQRRSVELAQRRLDLATELLMQGKKGALDVVDAETSLLLAQDALDRAKANLQILVLQYLRDTGTLRVDPAAGAIGRAMDRVAGRLSENLNAPAK
jgi:hypothetical protein